MGQRANEPEAAPLIFSFVPSEKSLKPIARRIGHAGRAYSLFEVATFFLDEPDYHEVRISVPRDAAAKGQRLYRCEKCDCVFAGKTDAISHVLARHLDEFYSREEKEGELPEGNFVCVARCGLSGELLGPPNFHRFNDRVAELHRTRYSHMPLDEYRRKIVNVRDAELVERWRQEARKCVVYSPRGTQEQNALMKFGDLEAHFAQHCAGSAIRSGLAFVAPAGAIERENGTIKAQARAAWRKERRFPINFAIALKSAFRHFGLHTFRGARGEIFVTSIMPSSTQPVQSVPVVRKILEYLGAHPGVAGKTLLSGALPDAGKEEIREGENHLRWLIGKGRVIEFSDGTMSLPPAHRQRSHGGKIGNEKPERTENLKPETPNPEHPPHTRIGG